MKEAIRQRARELGFDQCRFTTATPPQFARVFEQWLAAGRHGEMAYLQRNAPKRLDPQLVLAGAKTIVALAVSYAAALEPQPGLGQGLVARYARFDDYHDVLGRRLEALTAFLGQLAGTETHYLWYVDTGPFLERDLAQRAGIGFIGKHTNLISRHLGNWFFLAEIITTVPLEPDASEHNHCGSCTRCLTACPTGAITAPFQLDARLCISYLTIELKGSIPPPLRPAIGNRIFGCDDCLAACPWNRFAREGRLMQGHQRPDLAAPELLELLHLDESEFQRRFAGTPMLRSKRQGLRRNVCVALGNVGGPPALSALEGVALEADPVVAEHARWAIDQIHRREPSAPQQA
jgi:epoxyqueuosine reductase